MSIANELCSEVVNAVLMRQEDKGQVDPRETSRMLLEFHRTLRRLHADERRRVVAASESGSSRGLFSAGIDRGYR